MPDSGPDAAENALRSDRRFVSGMKKLDSAQLRELSGQLEQDLATGINFYNHLEDTLKAKARAGKLESQPDSQLAQLGNETVDACKHAEKVMAHGVSTLAEAGLDGVV